VTGRRLRAVLAVFALGFTGCMGDEDAEPRVGREGLERLVLQPSDLPRVFTRFDYGELTFTDFQPGAREDPARFERQGGWKARYRRPGSTETEGPLLIVSMIDVFADAGGAERDFMAYEDDLANRGSITRPDVGEEAVARTSRLGGVTYVDVAWRQGNVTAALSASGLRGRFFLRDATVLVRKQERRIARALIRSP
jgi:hypothetical protein